MNEMNGWAWQDEPNEETWQGRNWIQRKGDLKWFRWVMVFYDRDWVHWEGEEGDVAETRHR